MGITVASHVISGDTTFPGDPSNTHGNTSLLCHHDVTLWFRGKVKGSPKWFRFNQPHGHDYPWSKGNLNIWGRRGLDCLFWVCKRFSTKSIWLLPWSFVLYHTIFLKRWSLSICQITWSQRKREILEVFIKKMYYNSIKLLLSTTFFWWDVYMHKEAL